MEQALIQENNNNSEQNNKVDYNKNTIKKEIFDEEDLIMQ